ncbi:hypothetical protein FSP39_007456 [Pinctada imbricata]|uniref:Protein kinase domain-containing protein n=1 Tax=Pinctada imbricata TaxID=66713 RepID=A0AA88YAW9_PINIB|nr:hypothetical protein FSP39_007456 [Pinctada imbricata]
MSGQSNDFNVKSVDDIYRLPDVASCRTLAKQWGMNLKGLGLKSREDYVSHLVKHWNEKGDTASHPKANPNEGLRDAIEVDKKSRNRMVEKYDQINDFLKRLPPQYMKNLLNIYPNLAKDIEDRAKELKSRECTILVAGETGAGKSSFINLLLEREILPSAALSCSKTICEMRKSSDGRSFAVCHYKSNGGKKRPPDLLDLTKDGSIEDLRKRLIYVDNEDETPFEKIEVNMPFPMLEEGIVIVDTPGIGERRQEGKMLEKYLNKSFGSIYLVNTSAAGGVNKGRLRDFLRLVVNTASDDFNPNASIFIGNKIDAVDQKDLDEVQRRVVYKLQECYPGLKDDNVFFMSVAEAARAQLYGSRLKAHTNVLLHGIQKLYPASLRNKLNVHYRFQSEIVKRSLYTLKVARTLAASGMEKKQEEIDETKQRMDLLDRNARRTIADLRRDVQDEEENLWRQITEFLRSKNFTDRIFSISPRDCPRVQKDYKSVGREANEIIANRIAEEVDRWEEEKGIVDRIKDAIVGKFQKECQMYEDQIREIEGALTDGDVRMINDLHKSMKRQAPVKQLWQKANKAQKGSPKEKLGSLGSVVSSAGGFDSSYFKSIAKSYKGENSVQKMSEMTAKYIDSIFNGNDLKIKIDRFVHKFIRGIDVIAKKIPEFLEADRQLIQNMKDEIANAETNLQKFPDLLHRAAVIQGDLDLFYVQRVMEMDFRLRDVEFNPSQDFLGSGSFADVYRGKLLVGNYTETVALKMSKEYLRETNISDILLEDRTMRELDHDNIVRYYGSTLKQDEGKGRVRLYWIMVIEFCTDTLKNLVIDGAFDNPAKCRIYSVQVDQMELMAGYVKQMCAGLSYLHKKDLVNGEFSSLKEIAVKITDVGLTKGQRELAGSNVGSPAYMAPEVLLQEGIYDRKVDIYALGVILWEIWYGLDAADHIQQNLFGTLEKAVKGGLRPSMSLPEKPVDDWAALIKRCWDYDSKKRPEASEVFRFFDDFLKSSSPTN